MKKLLVLSLLTSITITASQKDTACNTTYHYLTVTFADGTTGSYPRGFIKQLGMAQQADDAIAQGIIEDDFKNELDLSRTYNLTKKDFDMLMDLILDPRHNDPKKLSLEKLLNLITHTDELLASNHYLNEKFNTILLDHMNKAVTKEAQEEFCNKLTSRQVVRLIDEIKRTASLLRTPEEPNKNFIDLIAQVIPKWNLDSVPMPNPQGGHAILKRFPLSIQDFIDYKFTYNLTPFRDVSGKLTIALNGQGITLLHGLANIPAIQSVQILYISGNPLTAISRGIFTNLRSLEEINLQQNNITSITTNTFVDLPSVQSINLAENAIKSIAPGAFKNLPKLEFINLNKYVIFGQNQHGSMQRLDTLSLANFVNTPSLTTIDAIGTISLYDLKDPQIQELKKKYKLITTLRHDLFNTWIVSLETNEPMVTASISNGYLDPQTLELIIPEDGYFDQDAGAIFVPSFKRLQPIVVSEIATGQSTIATVENGYLDPETKELIIPEGGILSQDGKWLQVPTLNGN